ncbi:hypothetical protein J3R82DRAFT_1430 [Butyriboletus roseoflavus]|nr:hypothetical protein J3R82DRAFT_1430 [Butyriboletus roseoflavus]
MAPARTTIATLRNRAMRRTSSAAPNTTVASDRLQPHASPAPSFVSDSALAKTGTDGSVGGLGTRDTINSGPQLSGLQINKRVKAEAVSAVTVDQSTAGKRNNKELFVQF